MKLNIYVILAIVTITSMANAQSTPPAEIREALNLQNGDFPPQEMGSETTEPTIPQPEETTPESNDTDSDSDFIALPTQTETVDGMESNSNSNNLITISLDDVLLEDVVRMFSRISHANIIAAPTNLSDRVTANLENVEWKPALSSILSMHNLSLSEKPLGSGVYSIIPKGTNSPDPLIVETIFLKYTTVSEVNPVITTMLPEGRGSISTFTSRNALVIRSTEDNLSEIKSVVKDIDIPSKQVCIEALFMELSDSAIKQLGIRWDSLEEFGVGVTAGPFSSTETTTRESGRTDGLTQGDSRSSVDNTDRLYDMYGSPYQVESVEIVERPDGSFVETTSIDPTRTLTDTIDLTRTASSEITDTFAKTITESQAAILNVDSMNLVISALKQTEGISVVSNPKMIVSNGATNAFFRVGSREPIIKKTRESGTTDSPGDTFTTELDTGITTDYIKGGYLHTGIELKVIPTVKTDRLIEALIEPSLRRKTSEKIVEDNSWPVISVKEIKTRFTLESGQTVAIGGLTDTTNEKVTTKIPLLGDIPLLGKYLFSHTKDSKQQVETIIFVTLTIADPQNLETEAAIPDRARLVHKRMIQGKVDKKSFNNDLDKLNKAAEIEMKEADTKSSTEGE